MAVTDKFSRWMFFEDSFSRWTLLSAVQMGVSHWFVQMGVSHWFVQMGVSHWFVQQAIVSYRLVQQTQFFSCCFRMID